MKRKKISLLIIFALMFTIVAPASFVAAETSFDTARYGDTLDIGPKLRFLENDEVYRAQLDAEIKALASELPFSQVKGNGKGNNSNANGNKVDSNETSATTESSADSNFTFDGGTKLFLGYNNGSYYFKNFTLRSVGENVEVWVAGDLSFQDGRPAHVVTQAQVDKLTNEFDNNMYTVETDFFGTPDSHTGASSLLSAWGYVPENYYTSRDGVERIIMLVDNIRDENYYDSTYPFFIAGFYSSTYEGYFDRNIINIDTNSWETRLESTFFGTTAHEFQHLIHDDNDSLEESWINEGMSDFAEYLVGYGHPWGHINFFLDHPENSLVEWDDHYSAVTGPETLADYGQAYLLQLYLNDKYGKDFIKMLAKETDHGIKGLNNVLAQYGAGIDFEELFRRFTVALAIDSPELENGIYNFESIDAKVNFESAAYFEKAGAPAWGGNYRTIDDSMKIHDITFDGIDFMPTFWKVMDDPFGLDNKVLWGNLGHEIDNQIILEADLTGVETATLTFDNFIDIEESWDFGMVQISLDNGTTWASLGNENTRSDIVSNGYPGIMEQLPGFTGYYENWNLETFDLTPYAGQKVLLNFRYMTDWGYNDSGWFIDNIEIPEIGYFNDGGSLNDFNSIDEINKVYVDYTVTFINEKSLGNGTNEQFYQVLNIDPFNVTEADAITLKGFLSGGNNRMIIWYPAPVGKKGSVAYSYEITTKSEYNKNK